MNFIKTYYTSNNKLLLILPITLFALAFILHYKMVMDFQDQMYMYNSNEVKDEAIKEELTIFKVNLFGYLALYILQLVGVIIAVNIGFLFFDYKFDFKKLSHIIIKSSIILIGIYLIIPIILYFTQTVYSFNDLYNFEADYTLLRFFKNTEIVWIKNTLEMVSITQLLFVLFLATGIKYFMTWTYKKALLQVTKIYGIGFFIWMCFVLIIEINFN